MRYLLIPILLLGLVLQVEGASRRALLLATTEKGGGGGSSLLLDDYSGSYSAYSVARKLRTAYSGSAIRIREAGGDTEADIGFSSNELDTSAIDSHCGANDCFVVTVYDQIGTNNLTQATTTAQPKIYDGATTSVLTGSNSKPCMLLQDTDDVIEVNNGSSLSLDLHYFVVFSVVSTVNNRSIVQMNGPTVCALAAATGPAVKIRNGSNLTGPSTVDGTWYVANCFFTTGDDSVSVNNGTPTTGTAGDTAPADDLGFGDGSVSANAEVSEWVIWNSDQSGNESGILSNINAFYSLY